MITVAMLVFGGVGRRHPDLDICISHGGGSLPMHRAKFRKLAERRPSSPDWLKEPGAFDAAVDRLWFDCHVPATKSSTSRCSRLGTERLVFGTNFGGWDKGTIGHLGDLPDLLNANAARLLRLEKRAPTCCLSARISRRTRRDQASVDGHHVSGGPFGAY